MCMEGQWTQTAKVLEGGRIVLTMPDLQAGEVVDILVRRHGSRRRPAKRGGFGLFKGKIAVSADFDAPLEDFRDYM
jgi:hypothetical protein